MRPPPSHWSQQPISPACPFPTTRFPRSLAYAVSPTLVRIEPKGPQGYEDRTTFMVVARDMSQALNISQSTTTEGVPKPRTRTGR